MRRSVAAAVIGVLAAIPLCSLVGCAGSSKSRAASAPNPGEVIPSRGGAMSFADARRKWDELLVAQRFGDQRQADLARVIDAVDQSIASDPTFPLFLSKRGDLILENPQPERVREARRLYEASLGPGVTRGAATGSERWAPGWIGLARCAFLLGDSPDALRHLRSADDAVTWLDSAPPPRMGGLIGLILDPPPAAPDPLDPALSESTRKSLLIAAMTEDAMWDLAARPIGEADPASAAIDVKRRYRAEIEFQRSLITRDAADPMAFESVFGWNPDHFRARLEKARRLLALAKYQDAQGVLRPYADLSNPKLAGNPDLLLSMAEIHTRQFLQTGAISQASQADGFLNILDQRHPWDARGYILHARVLARWSTLSGDPAKLADARRRVDAGEQRLRAFEGSLFENDLGRWRDELAQARRDIAAAGGGS